MFITIIEIGSATIGEQVRETSQNVYIHLRGSPHFESHNWLTADSSIIILIFTTNKENIPIEAATGGVL